MKKHRAATVVLGAVSALALATALPATPASATDEIACDGGGDVVTVTYVQDNAAHTRCWDKPGSVSLNLDGVTSFSSGAEEVVLFWTAGAGWQVSLLAPHTSAPFTGADAYHVYGFEVR
jgi:hypothetical protein